MSLLLVSAALMATGCRSPRSLHATRTEPQPPPSSGRFASPRSFNTSSLDLSDTQTSDLSFVRKLPDLRFLSLNHCPVRDLTPLKGSKLGTLYVQHTPVSDLSPLAGVPLTNLALSETAVVDLTPLKETRLQHLNLDATKVSDLTPLRGLSLKGLSLEHSLVTDLSPLKGMPLDFLNVEGTPVADLSPLRGMSMRGLHIQNTRVTDLSPLECQPLERIYLTPERIRSGFAVLRKMPTLKSINSMEPEAFWAVIDARGLGSDIAKESAETEK